MAYVGNIQQAGAVNRWPLIESHTVNLNTGGKTSSLSYRRGITTAAGETRKCLFWYSDGDLSSGSLNFYSESMPKGFKLSQYGQGGLGRPGIISSALFIEVSPDLKLGDYQFEIGVCVRGKDFGLFPITVAIVADSTVALPPRQPIILSFDLRKLMGGKDTNFEMYPDGTFLIVQDEGLRLPSPERPTVRTWKTGRLTETELNALIKMVQTSGLDALGPYYNFPGIPILGGPPGGITFGDTILDVTANVQGLRKSITAISFISPDGDKSFPDMPPALNQVYSALAALMDKATIIATRNI